jgi:hypothetical protein
MTNDEKLIDDTINGDMHKDMAIELYKLKSLDKKHKGESQLRQGAKNGFVFPQFYGDYYKNNVPILLKWSEDVELKDGTPINRHLSDVGLVKINKRGTITDDSSFYKHVQKVEDKFWNERYKTYTEWKDETWSNYQATGKVPFPTGFTASGVLGRNKALNTAIQGSAFHCLLWSFVEIDRIRRKEKWKTKIIGQIHDAIIFDVYPDELEYVARVVKRVMTEDLLEAWDWIIVPLEIEMDLFEVDGYWFDGRPYENFD